ncbi:MAG: hypothetical protein IH996_08220 [Proteobacteria bacterium]|nr:hypothetical protein [Pseudomonadota bacterium]
MANSGLFGCQAGGWRYSLISRPGGILGPAFRAGKPLGKISISQGRHRVGTGLAAMEGAALDAAETKALCGLFRANGAARRQGELHSSPILAL